MSAFTNMGCGGPYLADPYSGETDYQSDLHGYTRYAERQEEIDFIQYEARLGRVKGAWRDVRVLIQDHFYYRPDPQWGSERYAAWLKILRELLAVRRSIPVLAASAARRRPDWEREMLMRFNAVFHAETSK